MDKMCIYISSIYVCIYASYSRHSKHPPNVFMYCFWNGALESAPTPLYCFNLSPFPHNTLLNALTLLSFI